jgi:hypothetical protein
MSEVETAPERSTGGLPHFRAQTKWADYNDVPPKAGTNGWAVASFVLGVCGGLVLGVVFGIRALIQIGETRQKGKSLAIAGIALSVAWIAALVVAILSDHSGANRAADGTVTQQGTVLVLDLHVGDCAQDPGTGRLTVVTVVPCDQPHTAQVVARADIADDAYPGDSTAAADAGTACADAVKVTVDQAKVTDTMELVAAHPDAGAWDKGTRAATCLLTDAQPFTGSLLISSP